MFGMVCKILHRPITAFPCPLSPLLTPSPGTYPKDDHSYLSPPPIGPHVLACSIHVLIFV